MRLSLLLAALLPATAAVATAQTPTTITTTPPPPQIIVSADGEVKVTPDRATIFVSIETRAPRAAEAGAENARRARAVIDAIRKLRIPNDKISTEGYSVQPDWRYEERSQKLVGYVARNTVRIELEDIDRSGPVIDAALGAGANNISAMNFWSSRQDEARRNALAAAVAKARADAEAIARAAGGTLGTLLEVSTQQQFIPRPMYAEMAQARAADTPIQPGEQSITATVFTRWHFVSATR